MPCTIIRTDLNTIMFGRIVFFQSESGRCCSNHTIVWGAGGYDNYNKRPATIIYFSIDDIYCVINHGKRLETDLLNPRGNYSVTYYALIITYDVCIYTYTQEYRTRVYNDNTLRTYRIIIEVMSFPTFYRIISIQLYTG